MKIKSLLAATALSSVVVACTRPDAITTSIPSSSRDIAMLQPAEAPESELTALAGATGWLNSPALTAANLRGKVVLIDFWTYSCINWRRSMPYVRAWAERYEAQGLVVIGVHAPEFAFERSEDNVRWAAREMGIGYPIAIDNDYAIWRTFGNSYWPALYFLDAQGRVRGHQYGEGRYAEAEATLRKLLGEIGATPGSPAQVEVTARGMEVAADWENLKSPENYAGYERTRNFVSSEGVRREEAGRYALPERLALNHWALAGKWSIGKASTSLYEASGQVAYRFHARDLHVVMGPLDRGRSVRFRVLVDGKPPGTAKGVDVDTQGRGTVTVPRMYQLIRQTHPIVEREFEIEFLDAGVELFSFTFG